MLLYVILLFKSVLLSAYEIWITDCIDQNFAGLVHEFRIFLFFFLTTAILYRMQI